MQFNWEKGRIYGWLSSLPFDKLLLGLILAFLHLRMHALTDGSKLCGVTN